MSSHLSGRIQEMNTHSWKLVRDFRGDPDECWLWPRFRDHHGYGRAKYRGQNYGAHRLAAHFALGFDLESPHFVCHHCDNPPCFNPAHLFVGTPMDNVRDMIEKGRRAEPPAGEDHHFAKMTEAQVVEIKRRIFALEPRPQIARDYGLSQSHIEGIAWGRVWGHVAADGQTIVTAKGGCKLKLTDTDIAEIKRVHAARTATQAEIGARYGVSQSHISSIIRGRRRAVPH